ncbi:sterigmatocystin 8-o-methyltransferase precursor, partial [Stemphylium lycopersici]
DKPPDFSCNSAPLPETPQWENLRDQLNDAAHDLLRLVNGPKNDLRRWTWSILDLSAMQVALSCKLFERIPNDTVGWTAAEVARAVQVDEGFIQRILKMLATHRIFEEHTGGKFRHTASSSFLRTSSFSAMCDVALDDCFKAASDMNIWIEALSHSAESEVSPFSTRYGTSFYGYYDNNPGKAARFSTAMSAWSLGQFSTPMTWQRVHKTPEANRKAVDDSFVFLRENFDWLSLTNTNIVDVGGGNGHVSIDLAREFPHLRFTIQDLSLDQLSSAQDVDVQERVNFQQYDFFTVQPNREASVYLYRNIFHNHNDEDATKLLRSLLPALENRSEAVHILINDCIVPQYGTGGVTRSEENRHRQLDLMMMTLFGAKERTEKDWRKLLSNVDPRLQIVRMVYNPRGAGLVQVQLEPDAGAIEQQNSLTA